MPVTSCYACGTEAEPLAPLAVRGDMKVQSCTECGMAHVSPLVPAASPDPSEPVRNRVRLPDEEARKTA